MSTQSQWRWCRECAVLHFGGRFTARGDALVTGACAGSPDGRHSVAGSGQYTLVSNDDRAPGQPGWQWCRHCEGLFSLGAPPNLSGCLGATDRRHDPSASARYTLVHGEEFAVGQSDWHWCNLCRALFFGPTGSGACAGRPPERRREGHVVGGGVYNLLLDRSGSEIVHHNAGILAVHAALLPTDPAGAVLFFSGDNYGDANVPIETRAIDNTRIWYGGRPEAEAIQRVTPAPYRHDLFCCGQAFLSDGRLLAAGGTALARRRSQEEPDAMGHPHHWLGQPNAAIFYPWDGDGRWGVAAAMGGGRWYPTLVSGFREVIAMGGHPAGDAGVHSNTAVEVWRETERRWLTIGAEPQVVLNSIRTDPRPDPFVPAPRQRGGWPEQYPRLHVLPNGRVLVVRLTVRGGDRTFVMDPAHPQLGWRDLCPAPTDTLSPGGDASYSSGYFYLGSTVLLPLAGPDYRTRVLHVGERDPLILDLGPQGQGSPSSWTRTGAGVRTWLDRPGNQPPRRHHCNATLLPDGTVLVLGGVDTHLFGDTARANVLEAELFDPLRGTWERLAPLIAARNYHTTALLLPDGRVWIAGSSPGDAGWPQTIEAFSPPYMRRGPRPRSALPQGTAFPHDREITVPSPDAETVSRVTLVRCGSVTHGFNSDQRHVELAITGRTPTTLTVQTPPVGVAPYGWYMLFLINSFGVPSLATMVRIEVLVTMLEAVDDRALNTGYIIGNLADGGYVIFRPGQRPQGVGPWSPEVIDSALKRHAELSKYMSILDRLGLRHLVNEDGSAEPIVEAAGELDEESRELAVATAEGVSKIVGSLAAQGFEVSISHRGTSAVEGFFQPPPGPIPPIG